MMLKETITCPCDVKGPIPRVLYPAATQSSTHIHYAETHE